jgi:hypothetical protein
VCALIACGAPAQGQVASLQTINRAEEVGWADPDRGLRMLEEAGVAGDQQPGSGAVRSFSRCQAPWRKPSWMAVGAVQQAGGRAALVVVQLSRMERSDQLEQPESFFQGLRGQHAL